MGISQAGIAFRATKAIDDLDGFLTSVFDESAVEIPLPLSERFDVRNHSDVMVQTFGDVAFISNADLAWPLIRDDGRAATRLHAALGAPTLLVAFCHDDRAGHHGYAVFEGGRRVRTRLQTGVASGEPVLQESGAPLAFEQRSAHAQAAADPALTGRLLRDGLNTLFGVCPWETLLTPTYRFFRLGADAAGQASARVRPDRPPRKSWWQLRVN